MGVSRARRRAMPPAAVAIVAVAVAAVGFTGCGAPERVTVPAGESLAVTLDQELSTKTASEGDGFGATVSGAVTEGDRVLVPEGAKVRGEVTAVQSPDGDRPAILKLRFTEIEVRGETIPLEAEVTETNPRTYSETEGAAEKVGGGAAIGALLGGILGDDASDAVVGAAVGAAAGTAVTLGTRKSHGYLPQGSAVRIRLSAPVEAPAGEGG